LTTEEEADLLAATAANVCVSASLKIIYSGSEWCVPFVS
jgi:hypothetical protein